jgi:hypothetical protein
MLVWATGIPSLLRTPANYAHCKHKLANIQRRHEGLLAVTNGTELT